MYLSLNSLIRTDSLTYLNTFNIEVAQRCSDNRGPTVLSLIHSNITVYIKYMLHVPCKIELDGWMLEHCSIA